MYLIPLAWLYVVIMMSVAEATNTNGTVLGALVTFVLYGVLPVGLILYFMGTPARRRAIRAQEAAEQQARHEANAAPSAAQPDTGSHAPADPVAPVGKEP
jgi:hypothetical protein